MPLSITGPPVLDHDDGKLTTPFPATAIRLIVGPMLFPDGSPLTPGSALSATFITYRDDGAGTLLAWDPALKLWSAGLPSKPENLYPLPATATRGDGFWSATLMAVGQQDASGNEKFGSDRVTQLPLYSVQCSFTGRQSAGGAVESATSLRSAGVPILSTTAANTASVEVSPLPPAQANFVRVYVNPPAGSPIQLKLDWTSAAYAELSASGATVSILGTGAIQLTPAPGQMVIVKGALDASGGLFVNGAQVT